jgi:hypothetical protein
LISGLLLRVNRKARVGTITLFAPVTLAAVSLRQMILFQHACRSGSMRRYFAVVPTRSGQLHPTTLARDRIAQLL